MRVMAGAATLGELAGAIPIRADVQAEARTEVRNEVRAEEAAVIAELKKAIEIAMFVGRHLSRSNNHAQLLNTSNQKNELVVEEQSQGVISVSDDPNQRSDPAHAN